MNFKKMSAKALSVFMCLIMLFSVVAPAVSATAANIDTNNEKPDFNYVSLGDSMSNGYGSDGYAQGGSDGGYDQTGYDIFEMGEIGHYGKDAYTLKFEEHLKDVYGDFFNVNHSKLAVSATLSRDLLYLLRGGEYVDDGYAGFATFLGEYAWHLLASDTDTRIINPEFFSDLQDLYIEKVSDAHLITLALGNAEFGAYIMDRFMKILEFGGTTYDSTFVDTQLEALMENSDSKLLEKVLEIRDELLADLSGAEGAEKIENIVNLFMFTVLDFCNNYTKIIDRIVELNSDVDIVVVGLMNTLNGVTFEVNGEEYDMGKYMEIVLDTINTHIYTYATAQKANDPAYENANVYYAETAEVEVIADTYKDGIKENKLLRQRFFEAIVGKFGADGWEYGMIFGGMAAGGMVPPDYYTYFNKIDAVMDYEDDETSSTMQESLLSQFYLGFEKAILESSDGASLSLTDLAMLSDINSVFGVIMAGMEKADMMDLIVNSMVTKNEAYEAMSEKLMAELTITRGEHGQSYLTGYTPYYILYKFVYSIDTVDEFFAEMDELFVEYLTTMSVEEPSSEEDSEETEEYKAWKAKYDALVAKISDGIYTNYYYYMGKEDEIENEKVLKAWRQKSDIIAADICELAISTMWDFYTVGDYRYYVYADLFADLLCNDIVVGEGEDAVVYNLDGLLSLFGRCLIGNGIGAHPSADGHETLYEAVRGAYDDKYTTVDKNVDDLRDLCEYIYANYDEIYAKLYAEAITAGKIDEIVSYLEASKEFVNYAKDFALSYDEYFRGSDVAPQIILTANNAIKTIDAAIALVKEADVLDEATYNEFMKLIAALETNLADIATLIKIAAEDAYEFADEYVNENIVPVVIEQLLILNEQLMKAVEALNAANAEIKDIVNDVQNAVDEFFANNGFHADYTVSKDSFLLAIGDDTYYSEILAGKLGLTEAQFGTMEWNELDSSIIAKADLITISRNESVINHFAIDQLLGYVQNYVSVDLKAEANAYVEEALNHFFGEMKPSLDKDVAKVIIESVQGVVSEKIDLIADNSFIADATKTELDWAGLVGEENAKLIETAVDAIVADVLATGIADGFSTDIEVFDLFIENLDQIDPSAAAIIALFGTEEIEAMFGDYATYTLQLPVVEAVAFAVESYIYNYVQSNIDYAKTVYAISAINPNAQIVVLGGYNAFDGIGMEVTIGEIVIDLGEYLNNEVKAEVDNAFDFIYGEFVNGVDTIVTDENIEIALAAIDYFLACVEEIKALTPSIEFVDAVKDFEVTEDMIAAVVGAENVDFAKKVLYTVKFVLTETNVYDDVLANLATLPTAEDVISALSKLEAQIQNGIADLDAFVDAQLAELGLTVEELSEIVADLAIYAEIVKEEAAGLKDLVDSVFEAIATTDLRFDETVIDLGELFGDVISGTVSVNAIMQAHAIKNVIYVDIADAETIYDTINEGNLLDFVLSYVFDATVTDLSEAGHEYVAEQIYNALTITCDHYDDDNDHYCDNLVCDEKLSDCADNNKDHKCDLCGAELSACADNNKDHKCDLCGKETSKCADNNKDHKCDLCGKEISKCADANNDHKCDVCGKELTTCADANNDHKCDLCGKELTTCADANNDHNCDLCGAKLSDCADNNSDHNCDLCGAKLSDCADANNDHKCDVCGKELSTCADNDKDGKCDICGAKLGLSRTAVIIIVSASVVVAAGIGVGIFFGIKTGFFAKLFKKN